jgi:ectoine hydroxylase-related dioxygenase (phytanoyl-CoA dioxygenase family)
MPTTNRDLGLFTEQLAVEGWARTPPLFSHSQLNTLIDDLSSVLEAGTSRGGTRHLLDIPAVRELASSEPVRAIAESALGKNCFAVRGILFDKTPTANWKVTWHQDLTIAVRERRELHGFGPWSVKEGVPHVQPPVTVLERMVAVRIHLDECGPENGPVRVISGSHNFGRLSGAAIDVWKDEHTAIDCTVPRGGILAFFPLLLHSSSPSILPEHRRVIHLEFAAADLPGGLEWYYYSVNRKNLGASA